MTTVLDLLNAGLVTSGTRLTWKRRGGSSSTAEIQSNGFLKTEDGSLHKSPSGAARKFVGRPIDGWAVWRTPSGESLSDLRKKITGL
jgi:hypothetical protein